MWGFLNSTLNLGSGGNMLWLEPLFIKADLLIVSQGFCCFTVQVWAALDRRKPVCRCLNVYFGRWRVQVCDLRAALSVCFWLVLAACVQPTLKLICFLYCGCCAGCHLDPSFHGRVLPASCHTLAATVCVCVWGRLCAVHRYTNTEWNSWRGQGVW